MLLAQEITSSSLTAGAALYPLAIIALGVLVKWWMRDLVDSVRKVAEEVKQVVATQGALGQEMARMDERMKALRADHDRLQVVHAENDSRLSRLEGAK